MSNAGSLTRRGALRRRRWSAPDDQLPRVSRFGSSSAGGNSDSSSSSQSRPRRARLPIGAVRPEVYVPTGYVSRFHEDTGSIEPDSPNSMVLTPVELRRMPTSPAPSYHSLDLVTTVAVRGPVVHARDLSPTSTGSLPEYDQVERGPPTDHPGYYNFIIPGMELQPEETVWIGLEPSNWVSAPFVTDPNMPPCPGLQDGSCPIHEAHNAGNVFFEMRAPSAALMETLARHRVDHVFEGSCPPPPIWEALLRRVVGGETEASEDLLYRYRWWHCPQYRNRVIARRQPRIDISQSEVWRRRHQRQLLRGIGAVVDQASPLPITHSQGGDLLTAQVQEVGDDIDLEDNGGVQVPSISEADGDDVASLADGEVMEIGHDNGDELVERAFSDTDSIPLQFSDLFEGHSEPNAEMEANDATRSTDLLVPEIGPEASYYYQYGFVPPSQFPMVIAPLDLPAHPPCLSPLCPLHFPHAQGPFWDSGPIDLPTSLIPGPMARLREERVLAAYLDALCELGIGELFSTETRPPMFIWAAVERIVNGGPAPSDIDLVGRFRFFHCLGNRPIVGPEEEIEDHEEDEEEPSTPTSASTVVKEEETGDDDDRAQYWD